MEQKKTKRSFLGCLGRFLFSFMMVFISFALVFWLAIENERIQNFLVTKASQFLSNELGTTVEVKHVDFSLFNKVNLDSVFVEDTRGDTLIYAKSLRAGLSSGFVGLLNNDIKVSSLELNGAIFKVYRDTQYTNGNMQFLTDYFSGGTQASSTDTITLDTVAPRPFFLNVKNLYLNDFYIQEWDKIKGVNLEGWIKKGAFENLNFETETNSLKVNQIGLKDYTLKIQNFEKQAYDEPPILSKPKNPNALPFKAMAKNMSATNGRFILKILNGVDTRIKFVNTMDFEDLDVREIDIVAEDFWMQEDLRFTGKLKKITAKEKSGFELLPSHIDEVQVNCEEALLYGMQLNTPTSSISDTLEMRYKREGYYAFEDFVNQVRIKGKLQEGTKVSLKDIFTFAPELQDMRFFWKNKDEVIEIQGDVSGRINRLKTKDFRLKLGHRLTMKGDLRMRDVTKTNEQFFDLELDEMRTNIATIRQLVPDFNPPSQFDKLGQLHFNGRFTGFLNSFTADGYLKTDIGDARSDISLKGDGVDAKYKGSLSLVNFDLGAWTGNSDFGIVNFSSKVEDGSGLDLASVNANLSAEVRAFTFKGYKYEFLNINGKFDKQKFDGKLDIDDENIQMIFDGLVDLNGEKPRFDFDAKVQQLRLQPLNLSDKNISLKADLNFDFEGVTLKNLKGKALANQIMFQLDSTVIELDSLHAYAQRENQERIISIASEVLHGKMKGQFEVDELPEIFASYFRRNFPKFTEKIDFPAQYLNFDKSRYFDFDFNIDNSKNITKLISPKLDTIHDAQLKGMFDARQDSFIFSLEVEEFTYDDYHLKGIDITADLEKSNGSLDLIVNHTMRLSDSLSIPLIEFKNILLEDKLQFDFSLNDFSDVLDKMNLKGIFSIENEGLFKIVFDNSNLVILNQEWEIQEDNFVRFGKGKVETRNFKMNNVEQSQQMLKLNSINSNKGLEVIMNGFDISMLNSVINYEPLQFSGGFSLEARVKDIFKVEKMKARIQMDTFFVNNDPYGKLEFNAETANLSSPIDVDLGLEDKKSTITTQGKYYPPYHNTALVNHLDLDVNVKQFPLSFGDYLIGENVSNTAGTGTGKLKLKGHTSDLDLTGKLNIDKATTTIDYLNADLFIPEGEVNITSNLIDFTGVKVYDKEGNVAYATGGITKNKLQDLGLNVQLSAQEFVVMDTEEGDNELFYGKAVGEVDASFTGDFENTIMDITATTSDDTKIYLPISNSRSGSELSFVVFNSDTLKKNLVNQFVSEELQGLDLNLKLNVTTDAEILILIDEAAGDILRGRGNGELDIMVDKEGNFKMYGTVIVEEGDYLFTLMNVVNKPFRIEKGGSISWDGDPYEAIIDLKATYDKLSTSPYNFILEYLNGDSEKAAAQATTPVDLTMHLRNQLFKPDISFDISFPNLRGKLKTYTDSKLRIVEENPNELNRQVMGLIAIGSFFPSGLQSSSSPLIIEGSINTLSEMVSNQLSIYVNELLSEVVSDLDVDMNLKYNEITDYQADFQDVRSGSELEIRVKKGLLNNRLQINAGSNFDLVGGTDSGGFLAGDLLIEYLLTPSGRFKIRFYSQSNLTISGRRNQTGIGISYNQEFDRFSDLFKRENKKTVKVEKEYKTFLKNMRKAAGKVLY